MFVRLSISQPTLKAMTSLCKHSPHMATEYRHFHIYTQNCNINMHNAHMPISYTPHRIRYISSIVYRQLTYWIRIKINQRITQHTNRKWKPQANEWKSVMCDRSMMMMIWVCVRVCVCNVSMFAVEEFRRHKQHTKSESLPYLEV